MEIIHVSKNPELKILKARRSFENNNVQQVNTIKKCLFGAPEAQDVENLLKEQIREDWERIKSRFGIDIEDIENIENQRLDVHTPKKRKAQKSRSSNSKRRRLFQQPCPGDRQITDFYQIRKAAHPEKK